MPFHVLDELPLEDQREAARILRIASARRTATEAAYLAARADYLDNRVIEEDEDGNVLRASGLAVPADGQAGFAKGATFIERDAASGLAALHENTGTASDCDFRPLANPSTGALIPATSLTGATGGTQQLNSNTTAHWHRVIVPLDVVVDKVSLTVTAVGTSGTLDVACYSEDGQTKLFEVTTASISGGAVVTTAVPGVLLKAGAYYMAAVPNGTADVTVARLGGTTNNVAVAVSGEPVFAGTSSVTAGTLPAAVTPSSLTSLVNGAIVYRFN